MKNSLFFLFTFFLALGACKKDSEDRSPLTSDADFYFIGRLDGEEFRLEVMPNSDVKMYKLVVSGNSSGSNQCTGDYGAFLSSDDSNSAAFGVDFRQYFDGDCGTENDVFNTLFPTGSQSLLFGLGGKGVSVSYNDASGNYRSDLGTQSDAEFTITGTEVANDTSGIRQIVTGNVTCTLYNAQGDKKELTDGSFRLRLGTF